MRERRTAHLFYRVIALFVRPAMLNRVGGVVVLAALTGCAAAHPVLWSKPGATEDNAANEIGRCRSVARVVAPEPTYPALGSIGLRSGFTDSRQQRAFGDCMAAAGFTPQVAGEGAEPSTGAAVNAQPE